MASMLLLAGPESSAEDRWPLDARDEELLAGALRALVPYAVDPARAALVHEREGEVIGAWSRDGALMLSQLAPPAFAELRERLARPEQP